MNSPDTYLASAGIICSIGSTLDEVSRNLTRSNGMMITDKFTQGRSLSLGIVDTELPSLKGFPAQYSNRTNQLLMAAFDEIKDDFDHLRKGINPLRIGIVIGTSTSGIGEGEVALDHYLKTGHWPENFDYSHQEMVNPALAMANWLDIKGPTFVISTACSSGAKALASARRLLRMNVCDLVIAGGADSLCKLTVRGFSALEAVSEDRCQPFSANRKGINIGEGAGLFLVSRESGEIALSGVGETSDAHHFSAPHPEGLGAASAMSLALSDAGLSAGDIDYLNLHGTATAQNDQMEARAVANVLGLKTPCSSTKSLTGHTLGAAGAIEAAFCWISLRESKPMLPPHLWDNCADSELAPINLISAPDIATRPKCAMSNSFAFGGNNISLILERKEP